MGDSSQIGPLQLVTKLHIALLPPDTFLIPLGSSSPPHQYSARLNAEKLKAWAWGLKAGSIAKKYYTLRLAPEEDSARLTGFVHNAVTPVGSAVQIPIIFSHKCSW